MNYNPYSDAQDLQQLYDEETRAVEDERSNVVRLEKRVHELTSELEEVKTLYEAVRGNSSDTTLLDNLVYLSRPRGLDVNWKATMVRSKNVLLS